jgi:type I restriction enzyme S subunit
MVEPLGSALERYFKPDGRGKVMKASYYKNILNSKFLYYQLCNPEFTEYSLLTSRGAKMPRGDKEALLAFKIPILSLPEQKAIASVLSSLDDKIDLLHRQNKTLEAMAETLFRQWFVEEAEEDWEETELKRLCKVITKGTTPTSLDRSFVESGINFIKVNCIDKNGGYLLNKFNFIDEETHFSVLKRSILEESDILYSIAGTIGRAISVTKDILPANVNQALAIIRVDRNIINPLFVKYSLRDKDITFNLHSKIVHAVQPNLSLGEIGGTLLPVPDQKVLEKLNSVIVPIDSKIKSNKVQIRTIEKIRDTLLPKLMCGDARIGIN